MALSTSFTHVETTLLPLPHPGPDESQEDIAKRGLEVALSLLHNHDYMMEVSPNHQLHEAIHAADDCAVNVDALAAEFDVELSTAETGPGNTRVNGGPDWRHYEIHDSVPIVFGWRKELVFRTALRSTDHGMEALTDPGSTVTLHGKYKVCRTEGDPTTLTLVETATTHCSVFLAWYIKASIGNSHGDIHKTIKAKFVEEMKKR